MESAKDEAAPDAGARAPASRIAFERLRERTDELELIISGLLAFALLAVPGHLLDGWARNSVHVEGVYAFAMSFGFVVATGLCQALAIAFLVHLAIRGYWVGLIGLKATFPAGIRWERIPFMGAVTRPFYQQLIGDLGEAIDRADRAASILFAMTLLIALAMAWMGLLAGAGIVLAGAVGALFPDPERATQVLLLVGYFAFMVIGLTPVLLEKVVARQHAHGRPSPGLERLILAMLRALGFLIPQRLISPVQLTLQSNLPGRGFMGVYFAVVMAAMLFGGLQIANSVKFSLLHRYDVMTDEAVEHGMLNAHYETLRSDHDLMLRYPMIPSDRIAESHLRLFLPHRPQIDNVLARARCKALPGGRNEAEGAQATASARTCIASFWTITLDGKPIALEGFVPTERRDLGMRGLVGYLDIAALAPGRHDLRLEWNAQGEKTGIVRRREYFIPFWFTPGIELPAGGR
jgi:hypothetical protein